MYRLRNSVDNCATIATRAAGSSGADVADGALGTEVCASVGEAAAAKSKDASNVAGRKRIESSSARGGGLGIYLSCTGVTPEAGRGFRHGLGDRMSTMGRKRTFLVSV